VFPLVLLDTKLSILSTSNNTMPRVSKAKQNLRAQAALARSSRNSTQQNISQPSAASISRFSTPLSTPAVSPAPSDKPNGLLGEEIDGEQETFEIVDLPIPDVHGDPSSEFLEDEDGYHTDDDLSELEDNELEKSLERQREGEREIGQDAFHTLMRDVGQKEWKKAESNRRMGYGSKSSERTEHWRRQRAREKKAKAAEVQKSSVNQLKFRYKAITHLLCPENPPI